MKGLLWISLDALVHRSDRGVHYLSIPYSERLADNDILASICSRGDCHGRELQRPLQVGAHLSQGPRRGLDDVAFATLGYLEWFNHTRSHGKIIEDNSYVTPAEFEAVYYRQTEPALEAVTQSGCPRRPPTPQRRRVGSGTLRAGPRKPQPRLSVLTPWGTGKTRRSPGPGRRSPSASASLPSTSTVWRQVPRPTFRPRSRCVSMRSSRPLRHCVINPDCSRASNGGPSWCSLSGARADRDVPPDWFH